MKVGLIILIAVCTFAAAMVSNVRVTREDNFNPNEDTPAPICSRQNPCAWSIYTPGSKMIKANITNNMCVCMSGTVCEIDEDDKSKNEYVHRCRSPADGQKII